MDALRHANERLRCFIDANIIGVVIGSPSGSILEANDYYLHMIGYTRAEFEQGTVNWRNITPPEWLPSIEHAIQEIRQSGKCTPYEKEYIRRDGTRISVLLVETLLPGPVEQTAAFVLDITERKRAERQLRDLSSRYEAILASVPDIIMEVDYNKVYVWANRAGMEFFGEDVVGKEAAFYFEGEQETYEIVKPLFQGSEDVIYVESWQRRQDGEKRLLAWWCRALKDAEGNVTGALSTARDITDRKRVEEAMRESEQKLRLIAKNATDVIFAYDMQRRLIYVNPALEELTGYTVTELEETNYIDWLYLEDKARMMALWEDLFAGKRFSAEEFRIVTKDGQIKWCLSSWGPLYDECGRQIGVQGHERDITARKRAEIQLSEQLDELRRWHKATLERETRFLDLKREVNELLTLAGHPPRYPSAEESL